MPNKALRIMIADPEHYHRMQLERLFNHQGYFRIAPVSDEHEFLTLVDYGCELFDLILINANLANDTLDLPGFFVDNPQVRHVLIYNAQQGISATPRPFLQVSSTRLPDAVLVQRLMKSIDPAANESVPSWARTVGQRHGT